MEANSTSPTAPAFEYSGREMTRWQIVVDRAKRWLLWQRRKLPYLVWYGDEVDVRVTLSQDKLPSFELQTGGADALGHLFNGAFFEIEKRLREMGIGFDTGMGFEGRDWEWDFSLSGPIHVTFKGRAARPHLRKEPPPKPKLVAVA